jgi:hypothetical protein
MAEAYPLEWPEGWPRHKGQQDSDSRFKGPTYHWDRVIRGLHEELRRIGAENVVVSTNQPVRQDGWPYAQARTIRDTGVAVYFMRGGRSLVMAQDRFYTVLGNIRSLTMAIEGLRQMERHGGAQMMERAFTGFTAIAPPSWKKPWREVFGVKKEWRGDRGDLAMLYRQKARERHPDSGGNDTLMAELNVAYAEGRAELSA